VDVLIRLGDLMERVWDQKHKGKAPPHSIKLQAEHIDQIKKVHEANQDKVRKANEANPDMAKALKADASVLRFAKPIVINPAQVETRRTDPRPTVVGDTKGKVRPSIIRTDWDDSSSRLNSPSKSTESTSDASPASPASPASSTRSTSSQRGFFSSTAASDAAQAEADAQAARATALQAEIELGIKTTKNESVEAWVTDLWTRFFEPCSEDIMKGRQRDLVTSYVEFLNPGDPKGDNLTPAQKADRQTFEREIQAIADAHNADPRDLTGVSAYMNKHVALLLHARRGIVMRQAQVYAYERPLVDISGSSNRCWARAGWGAAVHALEKGEFVNRTMAAIQWLSKNGKLPDNSFKVNDHNKIRALYKSIVDHPEQEPANELYATEKRLLMMALAEHSTQYPLSKSREGTLKTLKSDLKLDDNKKENPQAEAEFPTALLNALGLPVIINTGSPGESPDLFFPANFNVNSARHPKNWPILYNTGGVSAGHWQFHMPRSNRPPATTTS